MTWYGNHRRQCHVRGTGHVLEDDLGRKRQRYGNDGGEDRRVAQLKPKHLIEDIMYIYKENYSMK